MYDKEVENPDSVLRCFTNKEKLWTRSTWRRCIDDTHVWATSELQAFTQVWKYLQFCGSKNIVFNKDKLALAEEETEIFGFQMSQSGVKPSLNQLESITEYKLPTQLREIHGFIGLVNQSTFCLSKDTRDTMEKLRKRLKTSIAWRWTEEDTENFNKLKQQVRTDAEKGIKRLSRKEGASLVLISDWSKARSGFCL